MPTKDSEMLDQVRALAEACIKQNKVLAIMGPTASGKSRLSMALAEVLPIEIISVDSALIYQGMDIGTAKPTAEEQAQVPHHLIDIRLPEQSYSAADFVADVNRLVPQIIARNRLPVLVGGTMMYFHALQQGMATLPQADAAIRAKWMAIWENTPVQLHQRLAEVDAVAAERIHANDPQRLIRALEVYELTGQPLSWHQQAGQQQAKCAFEMIKVGLIADDRKQIHQQIEERFDAMLAQHFLAEAEQLYANPNLHADLPAIRSVGYRQAWSFLAGEYDAPTFREKSIVATRQLAKRQLTWLRKETDLCVIDPFTCPLDKQLAQLLQLLQAQCVLSN